MTSIVIKEWEMIRANKGQFGIIGAIAGLTKSAVNFPAMTDSGNQDVATFPIESNSIITDLESVRGKRIASQAFCKNQRIRGVQVKFHLFDNPALGIFGEFKKFSFSNLGKIIADHAMHAFFLTSLPETLPDLRDTSREARNFGLDASNSSSSSSSVCLSSTSPNVAPFLSTILTTRFRGKDSLNVLEFSNRTIISFNKGITIVLSPFDFMEKVYHSLENLSSMAYADVATENYGSAAPIVIKE